MTLLYFIFVLGVTVLIHEFGHFLFAKRAGVYVYEFSIGMGPRLLKFKRKNDETEYSIRILPIGGFVSMAGEDMESDDDVPKEKQLLYKPWLDKFLIISAGVLFNFLLAIVLLFFIGMINGVNVGTTTIADVDKQYNAYDDGIRKGDKIVEIDGIRINDYDRLILEMQVRSGETLPIVVNRGGKKISLSITPTKKKDGNFLYGFSLNVDSKSGFVESIKYSFNKTKSLIVQMCLTIKYLITGKLSASNLAGPIGIYSIVGQSAKAGFLNIIYLIAYLCINVGFIDFIPLPAFDGGRLLFLIIEKIKGSKVNPKIENSIHTVGFFLLMLLMVFVTYNDIIRLFG